MRNEVYVELNYKEVSFYATVVFDRDQPIDLKYIVMSTDFTEDIPLHPSQLNAFETNQLFEAAQKMRAKFLEEA